jgi:Leucine-rich repeat (LRR) protein
LGNHNSGPIPSSLKNCPLELLDLSHNNLFGSIPKELFFISTLSIYLGLSHNSLSGTLPSEVGNPKNINEVDFSNNMISNEIPDSISGCQILVYLNLSRNIFQGTIPVSLGTLGGLFTLDLSYNNSSGTIPETIGRLLALSSLNLLFNKFEGRVPTDGAFQNATTVLITGNDGMCGGIPQLKLPPCSNHTTKKPHQKLVMMVSICSAFVFVTLIFVLCALDQMRQKTKSINQQRSILSEQYVRISVNELDNATNGLASENLIGAGSFGSMYKG